MRPPIITPKIDQIKKLSICLLDKIFNSFLLRYLIIIDPIIKPAIYAKLYQRISKMLKEKITGSIEGLIKIIISN